MLLRARRKACGEGQFDTLDPNCRRDAKHAGRRCGGGGEVGIFGDGLALPVINQTD
jgi:hypothetical protein